MICLFWIMSIDFYKKVFIQVGAIFEVEGCLFFPSSSITVLLEEASQAHKRLLSLWKNLRGSTVIAALYLWISLGHLFNMQPTIHPTFMFGHLRAIDIKSSRPLFFDLVCILFAVMSFPRLWSSGLICHSWSKFALELVCSCSFSPGPGFVLTLKFGHIRTRVVTCLLKAPAQDPSTELLSQPSAPSDCPSWRRISNKWTNLETNYSISHLEIWGVIWMRRCIALSMMLNTHSFFGPQFIGL